MSHDPALRSLVAGIGQLEADAKAILATHEASATRVITLERSYSTLAELSIAQDELFRESLRAVEARLYRASHVLAWAGFIDYLHGYLWERHKSELATERANWKLASPEDFRDHTDFVVIETGRVIGAYNRTVMKALHGLLNKRNECAHPSDYFPDLNGALGYLSDLFNRVDFLQRRPAA